MRSYSRQLVQYDTIESLSVEVDGRLTEHRFEIVTSYGQIIDDYELCQSCVTR